MKKHNDLALHRSSSCSSARSSIRKILPTITYTRISSTLAPELDINDEFSSTRFVHQKDSPLLNNNNINNISINNRTRNRLLSSFFRSLLNFITIPTSMIVVPASFKWLTIPTLSITPSLGRKVTGTLFGNRRGHVSFAVQDDPKSAPVLIVELSTSTSTLVKEMSSGLVRIALECEKLPAAARGGTRQGKLFQEPTWTMYCNGRKSGYAASRACNESDWHVLSTIQSVSAGAGVIPVVDDGRKSSVSEGELLYMRAKFERVVGSRDSEAFYMMNPDGNGGPELSIFLLRL